MITGYPYVHMLTTGVLHCMLGLAGCVTAVTGLRKESYITKYFVGALCVGFYTLLVGCLGIAAGVKILPDKKIRKLKTAYMVTAILSTILAAVACWMYAYGVGLKIMINILGDYQRIGLVGMGISCVEFILAIVSSSICCCCSSTTPGNTAPPQQSVSTITSQTAYGYSPNSFQYQPSIDRHHPSTVQSQTPYGYSPNSIQYQPSIDRHHPSTVQSQTPYGYSPNSIQYQPSIDGHDSSTVQNQPRTYQSQSFNGMQSEPVNPNQPSQKGKMAKTSIKLLKSLTKKVFKEAMDEDLGEE